jgi:uncharacterized membrane protein
MGRTVTETGAQLSPVRLTTGRLEAFSDGVIAIAATLLVIELNPPAPGEQLWEAVAHELPAMAAFAVSFLTILIFWVNHHALFAGVRRADRGVLFLNGLILLGISFISYPTAVLGQALQTETHAGPAALLYGLVLLATSAAFTVLWAYLSRHPQLLHPGVQPASALRRSLAGPLLYGLASITALVNAAVALVVVALVAGFFALPPRWRGRGPA